MVPMRHPETGHTTEVCDHPKAIDLMERRGWVRTDDDPVDDPDPDDEDADDEPAADPWDLPDA